MAFVLKADCVSGYIPYGLNNLLYKTELCQKSIVVLVFDLQCVCVLGCHLDVYRNKDVFICIDGCVFI